MKPRILAFTGALALVLLAYSNHFQNGFHFDDSHTIIDNHWITDIHNIPRFFTDGNTFSVLPSNRSYRPVVSTSLAIDYWIAGGLHPFWFHVSTFLWFLVLLWAMFVIFRHALGSDWAALFGVTLFGVHPVMAETVNYIIQRADLYATLGVVGGLALYVSRPGLRRFGIYLVPVVLGILSKSTACMFPALLFLWVWLIEGEHPLVALDKSLIPTAVCTMAGIFVVKMTPASFVAGASDPWLYRLSQPLILMDYLRDFFLPTDLSVDTDKTVIPGFTPAAFWSILFVVLLIVAIYACIRRRELRPVGFGLAWFLIASIPTSVIALAEVRNDHRMFFPFVGLALAAGYYVTFTILEWRAPIRAFLIAFTVATLYAFAWGTHERNEVWRNDETLWADVTAKSPHNGRGLMNYGLTKMAKGDYPGALELFNRAQLYTPNYYMLEINLGIACGALGNRTQAEQHFQRAISLAPQEAGPHFYYARWLAGIQRNSDARLQAQLAVSLNPDLTSARVLLGELKDSPATANDYVDQALNLFRAGRFADCVAVSHQAIRIDSSNVRAWNNLGACSNSLGDWDNGISAEREALRLDPTMQIARNNLAYALGHKEKTNK